MTDTGIFKWIWRFNAVVIAAAAVLVLLSSSQFLWRIISPNTNAQNTVDIVREATNVPETEVTETIIPVKWIEDKNVYLVHLYSNEVGASQIPRAVTEAVLGGSGYKKAINGSLLNIGHMNQGGTISWMFETNGQLIYRTHPIVKRNRQASEQIMTFYEVIAQDTNGDEKLSPKDNMALYAAKPDAIDVTKLADSLSAGITTLNREGGVQSVVVNKDDVVRVIEFNIETGSVIREIPIEN